ncbi:conjugal transfer protein TraI, partial [Legionella pneumophila serogroup 1]
INLLTEDWKQRAKDIGFDSQAFMQHRDKSQSISWLSGVKDRLLALVNKYKKDSSPSEIEAAHACVVVAIETLSQRTSIFSERMLTQEAMKQSLIYPKAVSRQSIIESIQQEIKSQTLYEARCFDRGERLLTTPWLLTLETETIARIDRNKGAVPAIAHLNAVTAFQKMRSSL